MGRKSSRRSKHKQFPPKFDADTTRQTAGVLARALQQLVGRRLDRLEAIEIDYGDGWELEETIVARLTTDRGDAVSISWFKFDEVRVAHGDLLPPPYNADNYQTRWVPLDVPELKPAIGMTIESVELGCASMTMGQQAFDIWTLLLLGGPQGWLEISNGLDCNEYHFHKSKPPGKFRSLCVKPASTGKRRRR